MATKSTKAKSQAKQEDPEEPVWTYRGYKLKSGELVTAMVHFFRAEIQRANVVRKGKDFLETEVAVGGTIGGTGVLGGNLYCDGTVSPGGSAGTLTVGGNYAQLLGSLAQHR